MRQTMGGLLILALALASPRDDGGRGGIGIDGTWDEVVRRPSREEHPGYLAPRGPATLVVDGHSIVVRAGDRVLRQSLARPVAGPGPRAADLMTVVGDEFWLTRAIYKVEGDTLTIAESGRDGDRPGDFTPRDLIDPSGGPQALVSVYKRRAE